MNKDYFTLNCDVPTLIVLDRFGDNYLILHFITNIAKRTVINVQCFDNECQKILISE